jgi:hypothetical protein
MQHNNVKYNLNIILYFIYLIMDIIQKEEQNIDLSKTDSVVSSVVKQFVFRAKMGLEKYGKTLDRTDLSFLDWIQHAQEEHMDAILYLEKLKQYKNMN